MLRIGHGYDIHRFNEQGDYILLAGVKIPHSKGIVAHSDGDVLIHAVCDALLGACSLGDIGHYFPDTEAQYKNADSRLLLAHVLKQVFKYHYRVVNIDATVITETPKLAPYIPLMCQNLAHDLQISVNDVNIKAKTNETLDDIGQKLAIAAHAVTLIRKINENIN